nr:nuclease-related domain-containing protein [Nesterenkonia sp. Act20]
MRLRYAGRCHLCGTDLPPRTEALYFPLLKKVACLDCPETVETDAAVPAPLGRGRAGLGAQREYERRRARDEARTREKWGRFGGIAVALSQEKQSTTAWAIGAEGERRIGARLDRVAEELGGLVLHDRKIPGSRANIDHILIVPSGVWVIDAKRYKGKVEVRRSGGFLTPLVEKLIVRGRDCTSLVEQSLRQVNLVREQVPAVPVTGMLCFHGAEWPLGGHLRIRGVQILWPRRVRRVVRTRSAASLDVEAIAERLAGHFRAAG